MRGGAILFTIACGICVVYGLMLLDTSVALAAEDSYYYLFVILQTLQLCVYAFALWAFWKLASIRKVNTNA